MAEHPSANFHPLVSREQAGNAIGRALNLFAGRGRHFSVKELANGTGVKDRMIECARLAPDNPDYRPLPDWALLSIARFLGPAFTNVWLHLAEQTASAAEDVDFDTMGRGCLDYAGALAAARSEDSPGGPDIVKSEEQVLNAKIRAIGQK